MGCDIIRINGTFKSENDVKKFIEIYNTTMAQKEKWFRPDDHQLSFNLFSVKNGEYFFGIETYGLFANPYNTALRTIIREFIMDNPESSFSLTYDLGWTHSYEIWIEEYCYDGKNLKIKFSNNFDSDEEDDEDWDYDEDEDYEDGDDFFDDEDEEKFETESYEYKFENNSLVLKAGDKDIL